MSFPENNVTHGDSCVVVEKKLKEPERYRVLLHNDDYTSMDFVVSVLRTVFHKTTEEATAIMLTVHRQGLGVCGVYTQEVAEGKVRRVHSLAHTANYPLKCTMEKVF
ncbi:MAG: ATP-dependent Clp protease adapter ClpS [Desulfovibrio sp.]|nr:ATP-dependent Clp protease adapter ClpS [Desulfovibrio sp.]